jgi:sugar-specific transcriptional regulator TrmB
MKKAIATKPGEPTKYVDLKPDEIAEVNKKEADVATKKADREAATLAKDNKKKLAASKIKLKLGLSDKEFDELRMAILG